MNTAADRQFEKLREACVKYLQYERKQRDYIDSRLIKTTLRALDKRIKDAVAVLKKMAMRDDALPAGVTMTKTKNGYDLRHRYKGRSYREWGPTFEEALELLAYDQAADLA